MADVDEASPIGYGLVFVAMFSASGMAIYARKFMQEFDAFDVGSVRMFTATLTVMPLSILLVGMNLDAVNGQGSVTILENESERHTCLALRNLFTFVDIN